jgi:hypothetical protein
MEEPNLLYNKHGEVGYRSFVCHAYVGIG